IINSNDDINILKANETLNLGDVKFMDSSSYVNASGQTVYSIPFHFKKSFVFRSSPVLNVISQSSDEEIVIDEVDANDNLKSVVVSTDGFEYPVYTQFLH